MIRLGLGLAVVNVAAAVVIDRLLRLRRGDAAREPMRMLVIIDAPVERVWAAIADVPAQVRWMHEMKELRLLDDGPIGPGTRGEATVRILGISVTDPVVIDVVEPPHRYGIRHEGLFTGRGLITLEPTADRAATIVRWEETLVPPLLPELGAVIQAPVLQAIFQGDLAHLKALVEAGELGAGEPHAA